MIGILYFDNLDSKIKQKKQTCLFPMTDHSSCDILGLFVCLLFHKPSAQLRAPGHVDGFFLILIIIFLIIETDRSKYNYMSVYAIL